MGKTIETEDEFAESVETDGFVPATAQVITQVLANQAKIAGLEAVVADLNAKVEALGKKPK